MSEVAVAEPGVEDAPPRALGSGSAQDRAGLRRVALRSRPRPNLLAAPLTALRGAGPKLAAAAAELGIASVGDLLAHVPHGYRERAPVREVTELRIGEQATVMVEVRSVGVRPTRRRNLRIVEATVADSSGPMKATWFNQSWLARRLAPGTRLLLNGRLDRHGFRVEAHEILGEQGGAQGIHTTGLVPVHPASERLRPNRIREWAWQAVDAARLAVDPLPAELRARRRLPAEADALLEVHFPGSRARAALARRAAGARRADPASGGACGEPVRAARVAARDRDRAGRRTGRALARVAALRAHRRPARRFRRPRRRPCLGPADAAAADGRSRLGQDGVRPIRDAAGARGGPPGGADGADRDPGRAARGDGRSAARASSRSRSRCSPARPPPPGAAKRSARLASGELGLVVGTHALIEPEVAFASLAVCVVDEQHRFGVSQRAALDAKGPGRARRRTSCT